MIKGNHNYLDMHESTYFNICVRAFTCENSLKSYPMFPWCFEIEFNGQLIQFSGIPNKVETKKKALKRAYYRAKWLQENSFNQRYK